MTDAESVRAVVPLALAAHRPVGRVHDRRTFDALRCSGMRRRSGPVMVTALLDPAAPGPRVAYAVNRSVGSAVQRNRLRRRLRAIVCGLDLVPGVYLVSASRGALAVPHDELTAHMRAASGA